MAACPTICNEVSLPLCPGIVFFAALNELDDAPVVVPNDLRNHALGVTVERQRGTNTDFTLQLQKMTERLIESVSTGDLAFVTPVALLKASAACDRDALDAGFGSVGLRLDSVISRIERDVPADKLGDELPPVVPLAAANYAVVIEGPDFRDDRNRYPTLAMANRAAEAFESMLKGVAVSHEANEEVFFMTRPPQFERTTKIYVEPIQN